MEIFILFLGGEDASVSDFSNSMLGKFNTFFWSLQGSSGKPAVEVPHKIKGISLSFHDITYSVKKKCSMLQRVMRKQPEKLDILKGLSGNIPPGSLVAVMGPSGSGLVLCAQPLIIQGKTTLLDILAGKSKTGKVGGKVLLNGLPPSDESYITNTAYVTEEDVNYATNIF